MNGVTHSDVSHFVQSLERRDLDTAMATVLRLFDAGVRIDGLVGSLLGPAQVEVGRRWQLGEWSIAQEQHASSIVDACLSALGAAEASGVGRGEHGWVVVGAVEDDWHALPARMIAESLRASGWKVTFVGASVSAERLRAAFATEQPDAALLSCSMDAFLLGAARCVDALADAGVPVVVGGRALGGDGARAERIGATGWACGPADATRVLDQLGATAQWRRSRSQEEPWLHVLRNEAAAAALTDLFLRWPRIAGLDAADLARVRLHLELAIGTAAAGALLDTPYLLADFAVWLDATIRAQAIEHPPAEHLIESVACALGPDSAWVGRQVAEAKARVDGPSLSAEGFALYAEQMPVTGAVPPEGADGGREPAEENRQDEPVLGAKSAARGGLDDAAEAVRARARVATARLTSLTASPDAPEPDDPLPRLRQQAEHLLADVAQGRITAGPNAERDVVRSSTHESAEDPGPVASARTSQVLDAARAQAARLLDEAEHDAARIHNEAVADADSVRAAAEAGANDLLAWAEAESLEWLAEAGRQVVAHLDEVQAESARILAAARADAARTTADASRMQSEVSARAAEVVQQAQEESERQHAQASVTSSAILAKARSEAAAITAEAQAEKTRLAEETEKLAAAAAELLELRLNEAEQARAAALEVRAAADAAIEADTRRLLGEAQVVCDRMIAEAKAEAELIRRAAMREPPEATHAVDLRDPAAHDDDDETVVSEVEPEPPRRRRFRA